MIRLPLLSLLLASTAAFGQTTRLLDFNQHVWASYSGDHGVAGRWGVHFDGQWRRADLGTEWQQFQLRPGVNFAASSNVRLTVGYAYTKSFPYGDYPARTSTPEHRIYQQALVSQRWGRTPVSHRVRMEQRWIRYPDPQPRRLTYQNRFRYMLKADIPLANDGAWYLPVFDEILIGLPPNYGARPFDHNRLFMGIGRVLPGVKVEAGYMNQFIGQRNGRIFEFNNTLLVTVTSGAPLSRLWKR